MTDIAVNSTIAALVTEIRSKLEEALSVAKAAESCARDGNVDHSVQILMDFESVACDAQDLFKATLAIKRNLLVDIS